jgi:sulfur carrier protein ThiS
MPKTFVVSKDGVVVNRISAEGISLESLTETYSPTGYVIAVEDDTVPEVPTNG